MLRLSSNYNEDEDKIQFSNGVGLTRDQIEAGGFGTLTDTIFRFSRSLAQMDVDDTEFSLLSAICLISGGKAEKKFCMIGFLAKSLSKKNKQNKNKNKNKNKKNSAKTGNGPQICCPNIFKRSLLFYRSLWVGGLGKSGATPRAHPRGAEALRPQATTPESPQLRKNAHETY